MANEDPGYTRWLRLRSCAAAALGDRCRGSVVPHHRRGHVGMGQRDHDHTAIPLCAHHHDAWHGVHAPFRAMTTDGRRSWTEAAIARYRHAYLDQPDWA